MAKAARRILIRARTDLEAKVEQTFRVVQIVAHLLAARQSAKAARQSMRPAVDEKLVVIPSVRLQIAELSDARVVMIDRRGDRLAHLIEARLARAIEHHKLARQ